MISKQTSKNQNTACSMGLCPVSNASSKTEVQVVNTTKCMNGMTKHSVLKDAPFIHKRKLNLPELLFDKYRWGYQNQANEIEHLKFKLWQAEEKLKNAHVELLRK